MWCVKNGDVRSLRANVRPVLMMPNTPSSWCTTSLASGTYKHHVETIDFLADRKGNNDAGQRLWAVHTNRQGSDLLTSHLAEKKPTKVYMPDLTRGKPFPKAEDGNKELLQKFFAGTWVSGAFDALADNSAKLEDRLPEAIDFANFLKESKGYTEVSILGYCWGMSIIRGGPSP